MRPQEGFVPHVTGLGSGERNILALHCTMAFGGSWNGLAKALGDGVTLIAPDMPSHGKSADWDEKSNFADTVFQAALGAMGEAPMDVIGHSFGAVTALRLAVARPDLVRSLTVFEPVFFAAAQGYDREAMRNHDERSAAFVEDIKKGRRAEAVRTFNAMWSNAGPGWDSLPERTRAAMTRAVHVVPDTQPFLYDDTAGLMEPGALDALEIPCLVMRGELTHPAIVAVNNGLERVIPGAGQSVIEGAGHMAPITHPGPVASEFEALLTRA